MMIRCIAVYVLAAAVCQAIHCQDPDDTIGQVVQPTVISQVRQNY